MRFRYKAKTKKDVTETGFIQALNLSEAKKMLLEKDLILLSVKKEKESKKNKSDIMAIGNVPHMDKILFAKHLSIMIKAGLTIREGVDTVAQQTTSKKFKNTLDEIVRHLDNGESLGNSLARYPKVFNQLFVNLVRVGEASGTLEENLSYLADHLEKSYTLRMKVIGAAIYPAIVLLATFGLAAGLSIFILPKLIPLFESFNVELPLATRILMASVKIVNSYWYIVISAALFLTVLVILLGRIKAVRRFYHRINLAMPIVGSIAAHSNLAQTTRTLGTLLRSGVSVIEALDITAKTTTNLVYQDALEITKLRVKRGKNIHFILKNYPKLFPAVVSRMVQVGEKSGKLEETLMYLAEFYEKEIDNTTKNLSNVLEPLLLVFIGLIVGFVAVSIILPIYQITRSLRG